jgi:hypothetical protein
VEGEIIYTYFYDFADKINLNEVKTYLRKAEEFSFFEYGKAVPEGLNPFELPVLLNGEKKEVKFDSVSLTVNLQCLIYSVGAMAIRVRTKLPDITQQLINKITFDKRFEKRFKEVADELKNKVEKSLSKYIVVKERKIFEMYRQYFLEQTQKDFFEKNKSWIAGILLDEQNYKELSEDYVNSTLKRDIRYYQYDYFVFDWDAMFALSFSSNYENEITVCDTANIQLLEYRIYQEEVDKMIDYVNDRFLGMRKSPLYALVTRRAMIRLSKEISDFYTEYKDLIGGVNKIVMSFGEWYLSKVYSALSDSFRLTDLEKRLQSTFDMLVNIRNFIQDQVSEDTSSFLEWIVIILFLIEIILLFLPSFKI